MLLHYHVVTLCYCITLNFDIQLLFLSCFVTPCSCIFLFLWHHVLVMYYPDMWRNVLVMSYPDMWHHALVLPWYVTPCPCNVLPWYVTLCSCITLICDIMPLYYPNMWHYALVLSSSDVWHHALVLPWFVTHCFLTIWHQYKVHLQHQNHTSIRTVICTEFSWRISRSIKICNTIFLSFQLQVFNFPLETQACHLTTMPF